MKAKVVDFLSPSPRRKPRIDGNQVVLGGIGYEILVESPTRIRFRQEWSRSNIIFEKDEVGQWKCSLTKWDGTVESNHYDRLAQAHMIIDEILELHGEEI